LYKGLADIAEVDTPKIDSIIEYCQKYMGKEYVVNGKLVGKDVGETSAPQKFGIRTIDDLKKLYYP
jgi:opine dehydrogenase